MTSALHRVLVNSFVCCTICRSTNTTTYALQHGVSIAPNLSQQAHFLVTAEPPSEDEVLGAMSIISWGLTLIVLVKYQLIVVNADDHGEGTQHCFCPICLPETINVQLLSLWA